MRWVWLGALVFLLGSCGGEPARDPGAPTAASATATSVDREWVAVFAVGGVDDLEPLTEELVAAAPDNVAVSPIGCWDGLAGAVDDPQAEYAATLVAPTRKALDAVVGRVDREPIHIGEYPSACVD